ncbi:hypothetical protein LSCM4_07229 [Leishmania orientalis]|uniref:Uncharacterized protein n=1 Tax=Leishmania orientalis TaxID=2249476 RepID=A0A836HKH8_9TRYP|nr:hypothetical protein LSCM4_07229 [Leishmania orientalis]
MSLLRVAQFLTADGKVQIDVTNISGRPQYPPSQEQSSQQQYPSSRRSDHACHVPDRDEPCSLIVSLRSSHPHLFYYRGPPNKQLLPSVSAPPPPPPAAPAASAARAGGGGGRGNNHNHQRSLSSLWGLEAIDPVIADVSRQSWRGFGFAPVEEPAAATAKSSAAPAATPSAFDKGISEGGGDDRPLLVREELADCVLLPGERRTFLLEVDTPSVLKQFMGLPAQKKELSPSTAASWGENARRRDSWIPFSRHGQTTPSSSDSRSVSSPRKLATAQTSTSGDDAAVPFSANARVQTAVFQSEQYDTAHTGKPNSTLPPTAARTVGKDAEAASFGGRSKNGDDGNRSDAYAPQVSKSKQLARLRTLPGNPDEDGNMSNLEDSDERTLTRQPLSIVRESTATRGSLDVTRLTATTTTSALERAPPGSAARDSRLSSEDYAMPTSIDSTSVSTPLSVSGGREGLRKLNARRYVGADDSVATRTSFDRDADEVADRMKGGKACSHRWLPPVSASQRPTFYLYYAPLGDENKCVDEARKWLLKEQHAYDLWIDKLVRIVVGLERRREQGWIRTGDNSVQSPYRSLGARRVLPPILGELVRWRADGGGSGAVLDAMAPSPITAAAFQYYYGNIPPQNVARPPLLLKGVGGISAYNSEAGGGSGGSNSNAGNRSGKGTIAELPPSFASTRRNRLSKKARKMFKEARHGAGTVVLPLRAPPHSAMQPSQEVRGFSKKLSAPQNGSGATSMSSPGQQSGNLRSYHDITSPQQYTMESSSEAGDHRGSLTPMIGSQRGEAGYERPYLKSGCGLALLEDPATGPPTSSRNSLGDAVNIMVPPTNDYLGPLTDFKQSFLISGSSKVGRTETLDPASAEMAATSLPMSHWSSFSGMPYQLQRGRSESPLQSRPGLPSLLSTGDTAPPESNIGNSPTAAAAGSGSVSGGAAQLSGSNLSPFSSGASGNAQSTDNSARASAARPAGTSTNGGREVVPQADPPGAANEGPLTANAPSGSFAAQLLQSLYGNGTKAKSDVDDEGNTASFRRDISSAPPQTLAYRPRNTVSTGIISLTGGTSGNPPILPQGRLIWIAERSVVAGGQAKVVVQQAAATAGSLLQQHGPPAMSGLISLLNLLKDTVFTPENVNVMQMVVTPILMACAVLVMTYLLILGGEGYGDSDVFSLMGGERV